MLDLNDPRSKDIFKAATYLDKLKNDCNLFILQGFSQRYTTFNRMKDTCREFIRFSEQVFPRELPLIRSLTVEILDEIAVLEQRNEACDEGNCTVCNKRLKTILLFDKSTLTFCGNCPSTIIAKLSELESPTEVIWI